MNNLKDIHNRISVPKMYRVVVLSGFQWTIWRIYTTYTILIFSISGLFYQDFNEQFEGYTQHKKRDYSLQDGCFIRISMNNLKDIHNSIHISVFLRSVVLSGFQWTIWRIYTTIIIMQPLVGKLFYQDFNEQFEGYTQPNNAPACVSACCFIRISMNNLKDIHNLFQSLHPLAPVVLSGFQWTIWRIYTTEALQDKKKCVLFYQDFNEQFAAKVQKKWEICKFTWNYFDISEKSTTFAPTNLKDIHNKDYSVV